jgi:hypothetical protein
MLGGSFVTCLKRFQVGLFFIAGSLAIEGTPQLHAQCDTWKPFVVNGFTGVGTNANCMTVWKGDLVVGGNFINVGGEQRNCIVRWDGSAWHSFTSGGQPGVQAPFGTQVFALTVFNGDLIAGGNFATAGGQTVNNIARWDGAAWHPLSSGGQIGLNSNVRALAVFDNQLYAGGDFWMAGGQTVNSIARWDGAAWHPIIAGGQTGVGGGVKTLAVWNDKLVAGGFFSTAGGQFANYVAAWDGSVWTRFISNGQTGVGGSSPQVDSLTAWNGSIVAGGTFTTAGGQTVNRIARWDGANWHPFTSGGEMGVNSTSISPQVFALTAYNDDLIAGGYFLTAGGQTVNHIARWDGVSGAWVPFTVSRQHGVDFTVLSLANWNATLVAGGSFANAGGTFVNRIAQWEDCGGAVCIADIAPVGGNGVVDVDDLLSVINGWGACADPKNCTADVAGGDGIVDVDDLLAIINAWGPCE